MASVTIMDYEAREDLLPPLCLKCGDPTTIRIKKKFSWYPRWVIFVAILGGLGLIVLVILALILTKRMTIQAPMCEKHRNHWRIYTAVGLGGFLLAVAGAVGICFYGAYYDNLPGHRGSGVWFYLFGTVGSVVIWLIVLAVFSLSTVRPTQITENRLTLTGVSDRFVDALENERDEAEEEDRREAKRRRRARRELEGDDESSLPPPSRRPAIEDDRIRE